MSFDLNFTNFDFDLIPKKTNISVKYIKEYLKSMDEGLKKKKLPPNLDYNQQLNNLIKDFQSRDLTLVLGAGISAPYGLPEWNTLLQKLISNLSDTKTKQQSRGISYVISKIYTELFPGNSLITARYLNQTYSELFPNSSLEFERKVRDSLYENIKTNWNSQPVKEIINLCYGSHRGIDSIITFNYDDIIEKAFENIKQRADLEIPYKSIYDNAIKPQKDEISIYHVHGFLPRDKPLTFRNKITLSEDFYHQQYNNTYSWNNIIQINKYRDKTCLFIGLSFTDPNLRRLLDISNQQKGSEDSDFHYVIRKRYDREKTKNQIKQIIEKNQNIFDDKLKNKLSLQEVNDKLIQLIENFEEKDDKSFGISTIWIDNFNEIENILKTIRSRKLL